MGKWIGVNEPEVQGKTLSEAARKLGVPVNIARDRHISGWTIREALGLDPREEHRGSPKMINEPEVQARSINEACETLGLNPSVVKSRVNRGGWTLRQALQLDPPPGGTHRVRKVDEPEIKAKSLHEAVAKLGLEFRTVNGRVARGWTVRQALDLDPPPERKKFGRHYSVYLIRDTRSGTVLYVGQTTRGDPKKRWEQHLADPKSLIGCHANQQGVEHFRFEVARTNMTQNESYAEERQLIEHHGTFAKGFNRMRSGFVGESGGSNPVNEPEIRAPSLMKACEKLGLIYGRVVSRMTRGWSIREALELDKRKENRYTIRINEPEIQANSLYEACKKLGMNYRSVKNRYSTLKWSLRESLELDDIYK